MAVSTRHVATCDRCKAEEDAPEHETTPPSWALLKLHLSDKILDWDLCSDCKQDLLTWIRRRDVPAL